MAVDTNTQTREFDMTRKEWTYEYAHTIVYECEHNVPLQAHMFQDIHKVSVYDQNQILASMLLIARMDDAAQDKKDYIEQWCKVLERLVKASW